MATRTYMTLSGTSMSSAVTSGVVALMIEASRSTNSARIALPPNAIKAILQHTAVPFAGVDELTQGAGSLNAAGAVAAGAHHRPDASARYVVAHVQRASRLRSCPTESGWRGGSGSSGASTCSLVIPSIRTNRLDQRGHLGQRGDLG